MNESEILEEGTPVLFFVEGEGDEVIEKEGEISSVNEDDDTYDAGGLTYDIEVAAEGKVYASVPASAVRELTAASGVEDGEYGFSEADMERDFWRTAESLWFGMDPRGDGENILPAEFQQALERAIDEDASGFAIDSTTPPEENE